MLDSMSSGDPGTRQRILFAARELLEKTSGAPVSMGEVARHAGVSRQAVYLQFADRTSLLLGVSRMADTAARTPERQRRIDDASTARESLREAIALQAMIKPDLHGVATALDVLRRTDPAADEAFKERDHMRLQRCRNVIDKLHIAGELAEHWSVDTAAHLLWAITSQRVWEDLVIDQGWTTDQYRTHLTDLLETALLTTR